MTASVAEHYARTGLARRILDAFDAEGTEVTVDTLAAVDEFHSGGRPATAAMTARLAPHADGEVLDVGCGIGGTARHLTTTYGCRVTGVDLTAEYVEAARVLTERVGLAERVSFREADAVRLPFPANAFDAVCAIHVGMNIADKRAWFAEIARVLRPGGRVGLLDMARTGDGGVGYPTPWAASAGTSFLASPAEYRECLAAAGLRVLAGRGRGHGTAPATGPATLSTRLLMDDLPAKQANVIAAVRSGALGPIELIAVRD